MGFGTRALTRCRNIADLRRLAQRRLPSAVFEFLDGGADDEWTARRNTEAFGDYDLLPRTLVDVGNIDTSVQVLGQRIALPVFISPTGGSRFFHPQGEAAVARAAARVGTFYSLATFGTASIEEVARVSAGPKMFQLYVMRDQALNTELIQRCRAAGFAALCITVDCPVSGNRERDVRNGLASRPRRLTPRAALSVLARPAWLWHFMKDRHLQPANFAGKVAPGPIGKDAMTEFVRRQLNPSVTWDDAQSLLRQWNGPCVIKGILRPADARRAADIGATAIMVSNHGGRQLDGAIPAIDALADIMEAVGDRVEVILDGGIRRGTHVLKALALGAKACTIGRPYLYGLAAGGEAGVEKVLGILRTELVRAMQLAGCTDVGTISEDLVRRASRRTANDK